jgi:hypothetical protein
MRVMAVAIAAVMAAYSVPAAEAAPKKRVDTYVAPTTTIVHRDEQGRTRTKILVQKRSYLDGGTEVMPGDVVTNRDNTINSFYYSPSSASVSNAGIVPPRPVPDPFFLPGKNNPFFN